MRSRAPSRSPSAAPSTIELGRHPAAEFPTPNGRDAFDYLVELCENGLAEALREVTPELHERLQFELKTIREMGFSDYFLIVSDFVGFAKQNGIRSAPAAARPRARSSPTASRSRISTRSATTCSSSASSTRAASRCPTWTSTSPSSGATASSTTSREVRPRPGRADHHFRDDGRPRRRPRRRARAGGPVRSRRPAREADPGAPGPDARGVPEARRQLIRRPTTPTRSRARWSILLGRSRVSTRQDSIHAAGVVIGAQPLMEVVPLQQKGHRPRKS